MEAVAREEIYKAIDIVGKRNNRFQVSDIVEKLVPLEPSRQYIYACLRLKVEDGTIVKQGEKSGTFYAIAAKAKYLENKYTRRYTNVNLEEHIIFDSIKKRVFFLQRIRENVFSIFDYAFQEMFNNAINHSKSKSIIVDTYKLEENIYFEIRDNGIGVFRNIKNKLNLKSDLEAIAELLKGKTTTDPANHTGEGIFFTSRISDVYEIESYGYKLRVDNTIPDIFVEKLNSEFKGTSISFQINSKTKKHLSEIFQKYQTNPEDHAFNKTDIKISLYTIGTIYISRSQARRVLAGLDKKFTTIILDFQKVTTIGQAFADEVFRVYTKKHPNIIIIPENMDDGVRFMVERALKNT